MMNNIVQFFQNPMQFLRGSRLQIPPNFNGSTNDLIQYWLNTGQISQEMYNEINAEAKKIMNNPMFRKAFGNHIQ